MKLDRNPMMHGASGTLGEAVYRFIRGQLIVSRRPKKRKSSTEKQQLMLNKSRRAARYAKTAMEDPVAKAEYATGVDIRKFSAYHVAFTDYMTAPEIDEIDTSLYKGEIGETIAITALDDFEVVSVSVELRDEKDNVIESGAAIQQPVKMHWYYAATKKNNTPSGTKFIVTAKDRPGNATVKSVVL